MHDAERRYFDAQLEHVLAELPQRVHALLAEVPLVVDDYPSRSILRETGVNRRDELCGLYTGVPLIHRSVEQTGHPSDVIHLFRLGILTEAMDAAGRITESELRRQIRLTILHEFGHYHGLDEQELEELGY